MKKSARVCAAALVASTLVGCGRSGLDDDFDLDAGAPDTGYRRPTIDGQVPPVDAQPPPPIDAQPPPIDAEPPPPDAGPDVEVPDAEIPDAGPCAPDPANFDIPGNGCDDDGDGTVDNTEVCDTAVGPNGDAFAFARAIGLCPVVGPNDTRWGVVSAQFTTGHLSNTAPPVAQHGTLPKFGNVVLPREGGLLGVLSTGSASETDSDNGPFFKGLKTGMQQMGTSDVPAGYPKIPQNCSSGSVAAASDVINMKLQIRVPKNARGFSIDYDFWTGEWPEWVCSDFNDQFLVYLTSTAFNGGAPENVTIDSQGMPPSVDFAFLDRCTPGAPTACSTGHIPVSASGCPAGESELAGTGFADPGVWCAQQSIGGGATGWLTTKAPVTPSEIITVELMIWDSTDGSYDSSVLVDNFRWRATPTTRDTGR